MSQTISQGAEKLYGVQRVCRIWEQARSTFYNTARQCATAEMRPAPQRRGPRPAISDEALLELIRADLESSPFTDEGHRKVWARLRVRDEVRVARKRVQPVASREECLQKSSGTPAGLAG